MNIYQHVEISDRELDSKLLIAIVAATRGHQVIVSDLSSLTRGIKLGLLAPGIFHTKSLTPSVMKIARHKFLVDKGFLITSIDEEGGLIDHGYEKFARVRYNEETIKQAAAIFCWGAEDANTLKQIYPIAAERIHQTGSPRADLWRPSFAPYWTPSSKTPNRPYLLVSSNLGAANNIRPFYKEIEFHRDAGYYDRDPELFRNSFNYIAEDYRMTLAFIEAIKHLASSSPAYDIVFRPHPVEDIDAWKVYLKDIPNVHVIREGSITSWLNNSFAVMHNGCTTALEASVSGKPIITYLPFKQDFEREIPNELGFKVKTLDDLSRVVIQLFTSSTQHQINTESVELSHTVSKKIFIDKKEFAAQKIVTVWENFSSEDLSQSNNWILYHLFLSAIRVKYTLVSMFRRLFSSRLGVNKKNSKFPPLDINNIQDRLFRLQNVLGLEASIECRLISNRTVLIRRKL